MSDAIKMIYEQWHDFARTRNVDALLDLYAADAIFESPLVSAILDRESGVLSGHLEIRLFLRREQNAGPTIWFGGLEPASIFLTDASWYGNIRVRHQTVNRSTFLKSWRSLTGRFRNTESIGDGLVVAYSLALLFLNPKT